MKNDESSEFVRSWYSLAFVCLFGLLLLFLLLLLLLLFFLGLGVNMSVTWLAQTRQLLVYLAENYLEHIRNLINSATHSVSKVNVSGVCQK